MVYGIIGTQPFCDWLTISPYYGDAYPPLERIVGIVRPQ
jgi:hypothetical protein